MVQMHRNSMDVTSHFIWHRSQKMMGSVGLRLQISTTVQIPSTENEYEIFPIDK